MQKTGPQEPQRIAKLLARAGVASRREIERMIEDRRIAIDGIPLETPATILTSLKGVTVDGVAVQEAEAARLFLFNKPPGVLTAANDPMGRATIYDRLPADLPRLMPVGRLDLNTEGLLLLTSDGEFKRELELPATGVERAYRARAYGDITQTQLEDLIEGIEIDGVRYGSINANLERRTGANVWIEMILTEGKNREVRRVLEYLGLQVSRLIRTRYGPFVIGELPVGGVGEVRQHDLEAFRASLKGNKAKAVEEARDKQIAVTGKPARARSERPRPTIEPEGVRRVRAPAPRKREIREDIDTRPQRPERIRPDAATQMPGGRAFARSGAAPARPERPARPDRSTTPQRPTRTPAGAAGNDTGRPAHVVHTSPSPRRPAVAPAVQDAPRSPEREDITTRPRRARAGSVTERPDPKPRPQRGAGWAKAKPKPGARAGKPKRPRS